MHINKLSTTAKRLNVFFKVLQKIIGISTIVVLCVLVVLTIVNSVNPNTVIGTELNKLVIGSVIIELAEDYTPDNTSILGYAWGYAILGAISAVVICVGLGYIRKILDPMAVGSPFHPDTSRYLKKLAILSLILGAIQSAGSAVETTSALHSFGLDNLVESDIIRSVTANYTVELGFIVVFFVLLLMSYIFSYGSELQKLSDETL